jgi:asparagine synthase (glutamine-hydrolysing)
VCGIAGLIHLSGRAICDSDLNQVLAKLAHRGPDGSSTWTHENVGFGHCRLAVLDLTSAGEQPMVSPDGRYVLNYNGEIYNFTELRSELENVGWSFKSTSDTEVVLYSLIEWGESAVAKFNGMFAFSFWDRDERTLLLSRDRFGIKPLYISLQDNTLTFASEQKAIIARKGFRKILKRESVFEYFTFQNFISENTLLEDIHKLPAGTISKIDLKHPNPKLESHRYWDYLFEDSSQAKDTLEYSEELNRLFTRAVNRQLVSDVAIGCYLSSGLDSSSIASIAIQSNRELNTFTVGFDSEFVEGYESNLDERYRARRIADWLGTNHHEYTLVAEDLESCISQLVWHLEEPRLGQSYPNFYAASLASKSVKVVLSGTGGDELFGGYPWRYFSPSKFSDRGEFVDSLFSYWHRLLEPNELKNFLAPILSDVDLNLPQAILTKVIDGHQANIDKSSDYLNLCMYFEAKTFLESFFLIEDKLGMAFGLETRVPFMDNQLVEFAMSCPVTLKLGSNPGISGYSPGRESRKNQQVPIRTSSGKQIFRKSMDSALPKDTLRAPKQGFTAPDANWYRSRNSDYIKRKMNKNSNLREYVDNSFLDSVLDSHFRGVRNFRSLIWSLIYFEEWLEQNL